MGLPKVGDLVAGESHRDPLSWDVDKIPATDLPVTRLLDLNDLTVEGWEIHDLAAGASQDLLILLGKIHWDFEANSEWLGRPWQDRRHYRYDLPSSYRIIHQHCDGTRTTIDLLKPMKDYWWIQPFLPEGYLLVGELPLDYSLVTDVFDLTGRFIRSFSLGENISYVQTTASGDIWVGYDEEHVYSDDGLSQSLAARFDRQGNVRFKFDQLPPVDETHDFSYLYAMNVTSDSEAWLSYYSNALYRPESTLVRIKDYEIDKTWRNLDEQTPVSYSSAFAVDGKRLLFGGGFDDYGSLYLAPLTGDSFRRYRPVENGDPIDSWWGFARGPWLYLWTDSTLYGVDASTLPALR